MVVGCDVFLKRLVVGGDVIYPKKEDFTEWITRLVGSVFRSGSSEIGRGPTCGWNKL
jgi:hypothetical protein